MKKAALVGLFFFASVSASATCPDLGGEFLCPPSERYKQPKEYAVSVEKSPFADEYTFKYASGNTAVLKADGKRNYSKEQKQWVRHSCDGKALLTEHFKTEKADKAAAWSKQEIDSDGNYKVTVTGNKVSLLCKRK